LLRFLKEALILAQGLQSLGDMNGVFSIGQIGLLGRQLQHYF
jgi:hypothetical protein